MIRRSVSLALCVAAAAGWSWGCRDSAPPPPRAAIERSAEEPLLIDVTVEAGVDFHHDNGATGRFSIVEIMGSGAALLDCDDDGDLDLVLRQGGPVPGSGAEGPGPADRLLRNELVVDEAGRPVLRFEDATEGSGLAGPGYGMGAATGDFDGDGRLDLYLTNVGPNRLLRAVGDCRFEDVTARSGTGGEAWTVAATFLDIDDDGDLDLWEGNYVLYPEAGIEPCRNARGEPDYCGPRAFRAAPDRIYRNLGGDRFEDASEALGLRAVAADRTLGAIAFDADGDGRADLFLAHDAGENHFWSPREDGMLVERAGLLGLAVNASGLRTGDMGVEVADFDGDLVPDLVSTHLGSEGMGFWMGSREGGFRERAASAGVVRATLGGTGFGVAVLDLENDGWLDLYVANGDIHRKPPDSQQPDVGPRFEEPDRLLANRKGRLVDVSASTPAVSGRSEVGRGVATGDLDNDGDLDLVLTNNGGPARVLLSRASELGPWTGVRLLDARGLEAVGSEATLFCADGRGLWRRSATDGSYASARDPRVHFGLGECRAPERLEVRWPDGSRESFDAPSPGAYHDLRQGTGRPAAAVAGVS